MTSEDPNRELIRAMGRVEGKMDGFLAALAAQSVRTDKHEERIQALEKWRYMRDGAVAIGMFLVLKWQEVIAVLR